MTLIRLIALSLLLVGFAGCSSETDSTSETSNDTPTVTTSTNEAPNVSAESVHEFSMPRIDGTEQSLKEYEGKVLVLVNVASKCGYTPQYADLQKFYEQNESRGVVVLGFPANNFGGQEPGTNEEIAQFCSADYGVKFPMFSKISVKGKDQHPLYAYLTTSTGEDVGWNFNKFIVGKDGKVIQHFKSGVKPDDKAFQQAIDSALQKG